MEDIMQERYFNPHQARQRPPTAYEDLLGDSLERAYAAGIHDLPGLIEYLNRAGPGCPVNGSETFWTEQSFQQELARLAA
ncbi:MAG TPA: recombinase-like helix-turn-helix domain-containing protein [Herbaspirillum sp.]|jgi:hypothetical protein